MKSLPSLGVQDNYRSEQCPPHGCAHKMYDVNGLVVGYGKH